MRPREGRWCCTPTGASPGRATAAPRPCGSPSHPPPGRNLASPRSAAAPLPEAEAGRECSSRAGRPWRGGGTRAASSGSTCCRRAERRRSCRRRWQVHRRCCPSRRRSHRAARGERAAVHLRTQRQSGAAPSEGRVRAPGATALGCSPCDRRPPPGCRARRRSSARTPAPPRRRRAQAAAAAPWRRPAEVPPTVSTCQLQGGRT
mmetsp:Transcript_21180/g.67490  ORF Transcript_21180/g.67490 Transcript_21180/m.67490 type:complete len:204 (+) Transcript_21180:576-1187(+)